MDRIQSLPDFVVAVDRLLRYNWVSEERDYEMTKDENDPEPHVFRDIVAIHNFLHPDDLRRLETEPEGENE